MFLDLLEEILLGTIYKDPPLDPWNGIIRDTNGQIPAPGSIVNGPLTIDAGVYDEEKRRNGLDWPATALTMCGWFRLRNLRMLAQEVLVRGIPGHFIETGVWRGGSCIMLAAVLANDSEIYGIEDYQSPFSSKGREVYVCDSFEGLPKPSRAEDANDLHHVMAPLLAVSLEDVRENFRRFGLLADNVKFVKGWFKDTLPALAGPFSLVRLDGDMYESTMDSLNALYSKLSPGGFLIVDDYNLPNCKRAVTEFRDLNNITDEIRTIDANGIYWRKS
jgi:predicted O-methyltransferase YrrM